jgi:Lipopolysaccharide assembly protein A domain
MLRFLKLLLLLPIGLAVVALMLALIVGVVLGGAAAWLAQSRHRRAERRLRRETERLRSEAARLKAMQPEPAGLSLPALKTS